MGLSTALALLRRGLRRVLVLEKHTVGHERAASSDHARAIRYEYSDAKIYSRMVGRSIPMWRELGERTGQELYVNSGVVCWGRGEAWHAHQSYLTLRELDVPIREITPQELCRLYPQFSVADMSYATINPEGGFLRASLCLAALASEVRALGGEIWEECEVVGLEEAAGGVSVGMADKESVTASRVALATGPWGAKLLPQLGVRVPLTANKQQSVFIGGLSAQFAPDNFPVFLNLDHDFYGFPLDPNGHLKVSIHMAGPTVDPDAPQSSDPAFTQKVLELVRTYIPDAALGQVARESTCMYAMTPDEDFILDYLPGRANVVVGAGFSGHGFKFGPLIGEMLAALLLEEQPEFPMERFSISRFTLPPVPR